LQKKYALGYYNALVDINKTIENSALTLLNDGIGIKPLHNLLDPNSCRNTVQVERYYMKFKYYIIIQTYLACWYYIYIHKHIESNYLSFLKAVTGSTYLHSDESIKVAPLNFERNRYCTSHTCMNQLDVSPQYNDLPGFSDEELSLIDPKDIFIRNLSEDLLANNNVMELV
jgi:hypothetical protein